MIWACRSNSVTRIVDANEVSFTSEISVFDSGGTATLVACGRMMRLSAPA